MVPPMPSALPRSLGGNVSVMMAGPMANAIAAPTACSTRKPMSQYTLVDRPHSSDPRMKMTSPAMKIGFLPRMSANRPTPSKSVAMVSK